MSSKLLLNLKLNMLCLALLTHATAASMAAAATRVNPPKPNIVFVLADDWGYGDVGAYKTLLSNGIDKVRRDLCKSLTYKCTPYFASTLCSHAGTFKAGCQKKDVLSPPNTTTITIKLTFPPTTFHPIYLFSLQRQSWIRWRQKARYLNSFTLWGPSAVHPVRPGLLAGPLPTKLSVSTSLSVITHRM